MNSDDIKHLETLQQITNSRIKMLEIQQTRLGYNTPPEINMEIEDLKVKLFNINKSLNTGTNETNVDLEDVITALIRTDETIMILLDKVVTLIQKSHQSASLELKNTRIIMIITILTMITMSIYTDKLTNILVIGIIPLVLYELYYFICIRRIEKAIEKI